MSLENVKAGDSIVVDRGHMGLRLATVDRVTSMHVVSGSSKFRINGGSLVGQDRWCRIWARPLTDELKTRIEEQDLREWIANLMRTKQGQALSIETIRQMKEIVEQAAIAAAGGG